MDRFEDYQQILSIATPPIDVFSPREHALDLARAANDGMAELVQRYPDRFPGFVASLPLMDADAAIGEAHRALGVLGARGIQLFSNINGRPLDRPEYLALFDLMAEYDLPVWLHPFRGADMTDYATETRSQYEIWWTFGWPYETSVAMARLVFAGVFEKHPGIKIIIHHLGAMAPYFEGRIGPGWDQLGARTSDVDFSDVRAAVDANARSTTSACSTATRPSSAPTTPRSAVCEFFGVDHVLFASDAPFDPEQGPMYIRETIGILDRLPISNDERERIYWRNAVELLKLEADGTSRGDVDVSRPLEIRGQLERSTRDVFTPEALGRARSADRVRRRRKSR